MSGLAPWEREPPVSIFQTTPAAQTTGNANPR
jgi:hypothetical protein